jgi:hypothetical protein
MHSSATTTPDVVVSSPALRQRAIATSGVPASVSSLLAVPRVPAALRRRSSSPEARAMMANSGSVSAPSAGTLSASTSTSGVVDSDASPTSDDARVRFEFNNASSESDDEDAEDDFDIHDRHSDAQSDVRSETSNLKRFGIDYYLSTSSDLIEG